MSLRLILTRHAKSSWNQPGLDDHDRPLNGRGRRSARALGAWLAQHGYAPGLVIRSSAKRTGETWEEIATELGNEAGLLTEPGLYQATPQDMLRILRGAETECVMMIGHNPAIGFMARAMAAEPPRHARFDRYPTCATTVYDIGASGWNSVDWGDGTVTDFTVPRDLGVD